MSDRILRRRRAAFAAGLATLGLAMGLAVPAEAARPTAYVALGDSYAAGVGGGSYQDLDCFRSENGYPAEADESKSVRLAANAACSGATIADVTTKQLERLNTGITLVTITAGGNDINSTAVLFTCVPDPASTQCAQAFGSAIAMIGQVEGRVVDMVEDVRAQAPEAKIVLTGYPYLFDPSNGRTPEEVAFMTNVNAAIAELNGAIARGAETSDAEFVDVTDEFADHAANSLVPWINGPGAGPIEAFHPNAAGYQAYHLALAAAEAYSTPTTP
ncbi:SGNH/GDSL hydrolase family protein [Arthrobacter oryzae]|uniref:SGNH/GDSL hydrolase family protein n=1 Tax=Arthrobacter oryzae TaxID=409290 RepID=UPI0030F496A1